MKRKGVKSDIIKSREYEMGMYIRSMTSMYQSSVIQSSVLFDIAMALTKGFTKITAEAIVEDTRIIKIFRYCVTPSISQMKFGQLFGLSSIGSFENEVQLNSQQHKKIATVAPRIAKFVTENLDHDRFLWLLHNLSESERSLARQYAKSWTCSLIADQNAQTEFRNWRRLSQETHIEDQLVVLGYMQTTHRGNVERISDINPGSYSKERRVQGRTIQKADLTVRHRDGKRLILIEAKAMGVEIDAYKRVKECCDKAADWRTNT